MTIEVRPAMPEEYEEAGRVTALAYREYVGPGESDWEAYLEHIADVAGRAGRTTVLVAVEDGRILGTATLELDHRVDEGVDQREDERLPADEAHVRMVGVHPEARGRRVGRDLMDACIRIARERGKTRMTLNTTSRMKVAQAMYETMGFVRQEDWQVNEDFSLLSYELSLG